MLGDSFRDREYGVLLAWLDRHPATVLPPTPHHPQWRVEGGTVVAVGDSPVAALRAYRKQMMAVRRRSPRPATDGAV